MTRTDKPAVAPAAGEAAVASTARLDQTIEQLRGGGFEIVAGPTPTPGAKGRLSASPFAIRTAGCSN